MREEDLKFTKVESTLSEMCRLEKLVMGIGVSLRWYDIVETNHTSALLQGM